MARLLLRVLAGLVAGSALSALAWAAAGAGHGTPMPLLVNMPVMILARGEAGIAVSLYGTPILWAAYYSLPGSVRGGTTIAFVALAINGGLVALFVLGAIVRLLSRFELPPAHVVPWALAYAAATAGLYLILRRTPAS